MVVLRRLFPATIVAVAVALLLVPVYVPVLRASGTLHIYLVPGETL